MLGLSKQEYADIRNNYIAGADHSPLHLVGETAIALELFRDSAPSPAFTLAAPDDPQVLAVLRLHAEEEKTLSLWDNLLNISGSASRAKAEGLWREYEQYALKETAPGYATMKFYNLDTRVLFLSLWIHERFRMSQVVDETTADPFVAVNEASTKRLNCIGRTILFQAIAERKGFSELAEAIEIESTDWFPHDSNRNAGHTWLQLKHPRLGELVLDLNPISEPRIFPLSTVRQLQGKVVTEMSAYLVGKTLSNGQLLASWLSSMKIKGENVAREQVELLFEDGCEPLMSVDDLPINELSRPVTMENDWTHVCQVATLALLAAQRLSEDECRLVLVNYVFVKLVVQKAETFRSFAKEMEAGEAGEAEKLKEIAEQIVDTCLMLVDSLKSLELPKELNFVDLESRTKRLMSDVNKLIDEDE
jgi:hypothetical protein